MHAAAPEKAARSTMADAKKPRTRKRKTRDEDDDFDGDGADDASGAASGPLDLDRPASAVAKSILASLGAVGGRAAMSEHGSSPRKEASRLDHTQGGLRSDPSAGRGVGRRRKAPAAPSRRNRGTRIVPGESRRRRRRRRRGRARGSSARNHGSSLGNRGGAVAGGAAAGHADRPLGIAAADTRIVAAGAAGNAD